VDEFKDTFGFRKNIIVPEPHDHKPHPLKVMCAQCIGRVICVLTTIQFNHQPKLPACEVCDILANRKLPPELCAINLTVSQVTPQVTFRLCHTAAQGSGASG
jgi:hypothetical protein